MKKSSTPKNSGSILCAAPKLSQCEPFAANPYEFKLYEELRRNLPVIDGALCKIVRLTGGFRLISGSKAHQAQLDDFVKNVPVGLGGKSLQSFADGFMDSLLTFGSAIGEMIPDKNTGQISCLNLGRAEDVAVTCGKNPSQRRYFIKNEKGEQKEIERPDLILYSALNPTPGSPYGTSVLKGLPAIAGILLKIYACIGQNFERCGNIRYAVTYKPDDPAEKSFAKERAAQIAQQWSEGMNAAKYGEIRDFIAVGDVDIKVIGSESQMISTEVPVRQLLEQLLAKLSIPPFMMGLNWSTTERMSSQQADMLTSELEYYRRLISPVLEQIGSDFLHLSGVRANARIEWFNINLQDETELASARLMNAQAEQVELLNEETKQKKGIN